MGPPPSVDTCTGALLRCCLPCSPAQLRHHRFVHCCEHSPPPVVVLLRGRWAPPLLSGPCVAIILFPPSAATRPPCAGVCASRVRVDARPRPRTQAATASPRAGRRRMPTCAAAHESRLHCRTPQFPYAHRRLGATPAPPCREEALAVAPPFTPDEMTFNMFKSMFQQFLFIFSTILLHRSNILLNMLISIVERDN